LITAPTGWRGREIKQGFRLSKMGALFITRPARFLSYGLSASQILPLESVVWQATPDNGLLPSKSMIKYNDHVGPCK